MTTKIIESPQSHPLEQVLNIEDGTTLVPCVEVQTDLVQHTTYDEKDNEIEGQLQEIYDNAMTAHDNNMLDMSAIEPKYRARLGEVSVAYLNAALGAVREKISLKTHKDKINIETAKAARPGTINNNLIVAERNEILKHLLGQTDENR